MRGKNFIYFSQKFLGSLCYALSLALVDSGSTSWAETMVGTVDQVEIKVNDLDLSILLMKCLGDRPNLRRTSARAMIASVRWERDAPVPREMERNHERRHQTPVALGRDIRHCPRAKPIDILEDDPIPPKMTSMWRNRPPNGVAFSVASAAFPVISAHLRGSELVVHFPAA